MKSKKTKTKNSKLNTPSEKKNKFDINCAVVNENTYFAVSASTNPILYLNSEIYKTKQKRLGFVFVGTNEEKVRSMRILARFANDIAYTAAQAWGIKIDENEELGKITISESPSVQNVENKAAPLPA